jgi:hypothetical protein
VNLLDIVVGFTCRQRSREELELGRWWRVISSGDIAVGMVRFSERYITDREREVFEARKDTKIDICLPQLIVKLGENTIHTQIVVKIKYQLAK